MLCITGDTTHFCDNIKSGLHQYRGLTLQGTSIPLPPKGKNNRRSNKGRFARGRLTVRRVVGVVSVHASSIFAVFRTHHAVGNLSVSVYRRANLRSRNIHRQAYGAQVVGRGLWFSVSHCASHGYRVRMGISWVWVRFGDVTSDASASTTEDCTGTPWHGLTSTQELPLGVISTMPGT